MDPGVQNDILARLAALEANAVSLRQGEMTADNAVALGGSDTSFSEASVLGGFAVDGDRVAALQTRNDLLVLGPLGISPWYDCTPITANGVTWAHYNAGNQKIQARKRGGMIEMRGWAKSTAGTYAYGATSADICALPAGFSSPQRLVAVPKRDGVGVRAVVLLDFQVRSGSLTPRIVGGHGGAGDNGATEFLSFDGLLIPT